MLEELRIANFAIIENTEIQFKSGMTVLTGETGAGKTIIIDAIGLLLGDRASNDMIRHGETKAVIEGVFQVRSMQLREELASLGIDVEDQIIITRSLTESRSTLRINNQVVTQANLKRIARYLLDIHLQHDTYRLIDPANYLELLDNFAAVSLDKYKNLRERYMEDYTKYQSIVHSNDSMLEQLDYFKFQLEELIEAELDIEEEENLESRQEELENYDKVFEQLSKTSELLSNQTSVNLHEAITAMQKLSSIPTYQELLVRLESSIIELEDIQETVQSKVRNLDFNPNELERIQSRLVVINRLKRKYKCSVEELLMKQQELVDKINAFENKDMVLQDQLKKLTLSHEVLVKESLLLSKQRKEAAKTLSNRLIEEAKELHLSNVQFEISFDDVTLDDVFKVDQFHSDGIDTIDFLISTNIGEPLKPLSRTASGGEMSRIMLGLKTVLLKAQKLSSIILDEIDSGVSGAVANGIAKKVKTISKDTQVLLITHLPQVAATADHHIYVSKHVLEGRTVSNTSYLEEEERVEEIAKMLSNEKVTTVARQHATELLHAFKS